MRPPKGTTHIVLDTPAGLHGKRLDEVMKLADKVLIPLQPSIFDIHATHEFVERAARAPAQRARCSTAVVGMRTREGTISTDQLRQFLARVDVPLLGFLRDTQNYVHLAAHGLTLWDVALDPLPARPRAVGADRHLGRTEVRTVRDASPTLPSALVGQEIGISDWIDGRRRSASSCSPMPPAITSGSTSTPSAPRPARSARRSRTASSRSRCCPR